MTFRRLAFPFWLARTRLARRGGRLALVVIGLAAASAMLAAVLTGTLGAEDRAVGRKISTLSPDVRAVRVNWYSVGGQAAPYPTLDARVRRELANVAGRRPFRTSLYRDSTIGGAYLGIGAVDGLRDWVRLRSGRLPRVCSPARCEVLVIRRGGPVPNVPGLRLVAVGEGDLRSATLFGDSVPVAGQLQSDFVRAMVRYHRPAPPPLVLTDGVAALDRLPLLHDAYRSYGWVLPLDRTLVRSWAVRSLVRRIDIVRSTLQADPFGFALRAPTEELTAAADSSRVAGRRLFLLGGEAVALLLAFAVLAAVRLRRDVEDTRRRLVSSGVRRWQVGAEVVVESLAMAVAGTLLGWILGMAVAIVLADRAGEPVVVSAGEDGSAPAEPEEAAVSAGPGETVTRLEAVEKAYGSSQSGARVFSGLAASFEAARVTVVTGPSGSGKTTLLHLLAGLELVDAGRIEVCGSAVEELDRAGRAKLRRHHVALVGQRPGLVPFLSARENVELAEEIRGVPHGRAHELLAAVGLAERSEQRVSRLSAGEQVRVAVARALAAQPELLLVDEPSARLDQANALTLAALLSRLARETGAAVVCATHDPVLIEQADAQLALA